MLAWSPLHGGLLSGALRKLEEGTAVKTAQGRAMQALEAHRDAVAGYEKLCAGIGADPAEVGMAWVMSRPGVTAPVIGPRSIGQLEGALGALDLNLTDELLAGIDQLFPPLGNGGPGPEAWAW